MKPPFFCRMLLFLPVSVVLFSKKISLLLLFSLLRSRCEVVYITYNYLNESLLLKMGTEKVVSDLIAFLDLASRLLNDHFKKYSRPFCVYAVCIHDIWCFGLAHMVFRFPKQARYNGLFDK